MQDLVLFSFLIRHKNLFPAFVLHIHGHGILSEKILSGHLTQIDQRQSKAIHKKWAELLHHIKSKPRPSRPVPVKKSPLLQIAI